MTTLIKFSSAEVAEPVDFEGISAAAREGDEHITGGAVGYPNHWADFTIEVPSASVVRINEGRLFVDDIVYDLAASEDISLLTQLPTVAGDERIVALLVRGEEEDVSETRFVETDVETGETVPESLPKKNIRKVVFTLQQGDASPTPLKPSVAANNCCLAYVRLATTGIVSVESSNDHRVKTLYEVEGRVTVLEGQMVIAFQRTTTLATDLANLQSRFSEIPRPEIIRQLQRDAARVRRLLDLPDEARAYFYDPGLSKRVWDTGHASWLARVEEGIRFGWAAERDSQLAVVNPAATDIRIQDGVLMPAWTEARRIEVDGSGGTRNISQQVHTVTTPVQRFASRSAVSYGPTVAMCGNTSEYSAFDAAHVGQTFQANGETFEKIGVIEAGFGSSVDLGDFNASHGVTYGIDDVVVHNSQASDSGNRLIYAARSVQVDSWTETYWDYVTETFGINGSVYAQTFLLTQPIILTSIELAFDRVASDGAVTLMLTEVSTTGEPLYERVIAKSVLSADQMAKGWVRFPFVPRYLPPGKRYAWVTVTTGNHSLRTVTGSKYTQGSLFWSTDLAWFQGAPEEDFAFRVNGAEFANTRAVVVFDPLTLENGMTEIKLLYESWVPDGTSMMWEIRPSGTTEWKQIRPETADAPNPLRGLPALCELRLTMIGTSGLAPAIMLNSKARGVTRRPRPDATAPTRVLEFGLSTTSILVELSVDMYDETLHTVTPKVIVGSTVYDASTISIARDVSKAERRLISATFTVAATTEARVQIDMDTTSVQAVPFVENISAFAL